MLTTVWELPNGTLAAPRFLSNLSDAPMLGEAAILWFMSIQPETGFPVKTGGSVPSFVCIVLTGALLFGMWRIAAAIKDFRASLRVPVPIVSTPMFQCLVWAGLIISTLAATWLGRDLLGLALLLAALLIPRRKKCVTDEKAANGNEDTTRNGGRAEE